MLPSLYAIHVRACTSVSSHLDTLTSVYVMKGDEQATHNTIQLIVATKDAHPTMNYGDSILST